MNIIRAWKIKMKVPLGESFFYSCASSWHTRGTYCVCELPYHATDIQEAAIGTYSLVKICSLKRTVLVVGTTVEPR